MGQAVRSLLRGPRRVIEHFKTVSNPLTIIAIFSGIAEVSRTVVLPFIDHPDQLIFIYFLISFPVLLVLLLYVTLNLNHKVLYAPSDFRNKRFFFDLIRPAPLSEINSKLDAETKELQSNTKSTTNAQTENKSEEQLQRDFPVRTDDERKTYSNLRRRYFVGEQLVLGSGLNWVRSNRRGRRRSRRRTRRFLRACRSGSRRV